MCPEPRLPFGNVFALTKFASNFACKNHFRHVKHGLFMERWQARAYASYASYASCSSLMWRQCQVLSAATLRHHVVETVVQFCDVTTLSNVIATATSYGTVGLL